MACKVYFRLILYLSFIFNISSETTLFIQNVSRGKYNSTCTGNANSTLTWIGYKKHVDPKNVYIGNPYKGSKVKLRNSFNFNLPPVLDWRWKDFRTESYTCENSGIITTSVSDVKLLTFSIRFTGHVKLMMVDADGLHEAILDENTSKVAFSSRVSNFKHRCRDLQPKNPWRHYSLYSVEGKYYVSKHAEKNVSKINIVTLKIVALESNIQLKIHKYSVAALSNLTITNGLDICRSVFYYTQRTCNIRINKDIINIHGMNSWTETKFLGPNLKVSSDSSIFIDIRSCNNQTEGKINTLSTELSGCQNLNEEFSLTVSKPERQNFTNNICQTYPELCKKHLVCRSDGCFCLPKYEGDYCEKDRSMEIQQNLCEGWGPNCEFDCNGNCRNKTCNAETGDCLSGCISNFYGSKCLNYCPKNCKDSICDFKTGKCLRGCTSNFQGDTCNECLSAYWGQNCELACGESCKENECNKLDGSCRDGCKIGYFGPKCNKDCPKNCNDGKCDLKSGKCNSGCRSNFQGVYCGDCLPGYWSQNCDLTCAEGCNGKECNVSNGSCIRGCKIGYNGTNCEKCNFSWGYLCQRSCGRGCSQVCNFVNGSCKCRDGYEGELCEDYTHLHEKPELVIVGPDWIRLRINISELNENNSIQVFEKGKSCLIEKKKDLFIITKLEPGTSYEFEVVVCYNEICPKENHKKQFINATTCTELNETLIQIEPSDYSITINTFKKETYCDERYYNYRINGETSTLSLNVTTEIPNLNPYTKYDIQIVREEKNIYRKEVITKEAPPTAPTNLTSVEDNWIMWNIPSRSNGLLKTFKIFLNEKYVAEVAYINMTDTYRYKLKDLLQATTYNISVQAVNSLEGEKANLIIYTKPPIPEVTHFSTSNCDVNFCNVMIILEKNVNSIIYETNALDNCEGEIKQKQEIKGNNIITLNRVNRNSTICVENNFHGKTTHFKKVLQAEATETKNAKLFYLFFLILIPITFLVFIVYRSRRRKVYTVVSQQQQNRVVQFKALEPISLYEEVTDINRSQIGQYLQNLVYDEGPSRLDIEFGNIQTEAVDKKAGILEKNSMKNRYKNIIPNDDTRVILKDSSEDYINASYIQGYNGDKTYIATQCPKMITENDFWLMVWQEEVEIIVMLSTLSEGMNKMSQYWPNDLSSGDYRKLMVTHVETEQRTDFVIRTFIVSRDNIQKKVRQVNYTTWPDRNIPIFPLSLVDFMKYIQLINRDNRAPIIVHCSAGIGRTGVYIMCDHYINTKDEIINIPQKLGALRKSRSLVQTELQYRLIYFIVDEITNMDVTKNVSIELIKLANKTIIDEYVSSDLRYILGRAYLDKLLYSSIKPMDERPEANRNPRIKAVSESTIILPRLKEDENSIYINAVYVHGFEQGNKFISTQLPLPATVREFWRLVYEKEPAVIIALQDVFNSNDMSVFQFWPKQGEILTVTTFLEVFLENDQNEEFYTVYNLKILHTKLDNEVKVKLFNFRAWSCEKKVPNSLESFLALYNNVSKLTPQKSKIVLCCYDSAVGSGLYIAFNLLVKKMKYDKIFNVCWAVRSIRRFRNEFVTSKEQLVFLYQVASYYINNHLHELHDYENTCNNDVIDQMYENVFQDWNALKF